MEYFFAKGAGGKGPLGVAIAHNGMARALDLIIHSQERDGPEAPIAPELFEAVKEDNAARQKLIDLGIGDIDANAIIRERNGDIVLSSGFYAGRNKLKRMGGAACIGAMTDVLVGVPSIVKRKINNLHD